MLTLVKTKEFITRRIMIGLFVIFTAAVLVPNRQATADRIGELPAAGNPIVGTLSSETTDAMSLVITAGPQRTVAMKPLAGIAAQYWTLSPTGLDTVRIQIFAAGRLWSLSVNRETGKVGFERSDRQVEQLWRMNPSPNRRGTVRIESAALPGSFLYGERDGRVGVATPSGLANQNWYFEDAAPPAEINLPTVEMSQQAVRSNEPLTPARTEFRNTQQNEVWVLITDLRDPVNGQTKRVRIPPAQSVVVEFDRDPGATLIESYEVSNPLTGTYRQEFITAVPPTTIYDVTVYEQFLQSIAIDRTGKSPNVIEDINYQPKSVGFFTIPAGPAYSGGVIDIYEAAKRQNNTGAVRPINPKDWVEAASTTDPLNQILEGMRSRR